MILSKGNLQAMHCTAKNPPILNHVHFTEDGTSVAFDGKMLVAVSPVSDKTREVVPLENSVGTGDVTVSVETVKEILKNMPSDKKFNGVLEHCDLDGEGKFTLTDGKRLRSITGKIFSREFLDFRKVFAKAKASPVKQRVALNRERLTKLLEFLGKVCPDGGNEVPVYLEFTEDGGVLARVEHLVTGQRALGYMTALQEAREGAWLEADGWEEGLAVKKAPEPSEGVK